MRTTGNFTGPSVLLMTLVVLVSGHDQLHRHRRHIIDEDDDNDQLNFPDEQTVSDEDLSQRFEDVMRLIRNRQRTNICSKEHAPTITRSTPLQERAVCPWHWVINVDENRKPEILHEAQCQCRQARECRVFACETVTMSIDVYYKNGSGYAQGKFDLAVACVATLPYQAPSPDMDGLITHVQPALPQNDMFLV